MSSFRLAMWITAVALFLMFIKDAVGHEAQSGWTYPQECCRDHQDCEQIHDPNISFSDNGIHITVNPGEHKRATELKGPIQCFFPWRVESRSWDITPGSTIPNPQIKQSGDDHDHVCIGNATSDYYCRCAYIGNRGF